MARGYSASRSKSLRPTLRQKRQRSLSMHILQQQQQQQHKRRQEQPQATPQAPASDMSDDKDAGTTTTSAATTTTTRTRRSASAMTRTRTTSLMRRHVDAREARLARAGVVLRDGRAADDDDDDDDGGIVVDAADECARETVLRPDVMTKYKTVGRIVDEVLDVLAAACVAGANTHALCELGDREALARLQAVFAKTRDADGQRLTRGLAYPTNVSVNEVVCNAAPFRSEDGQLLWVGDVVKLHLGCHLDGYPVSAARTVLVPARDNDDNNSNNDNNNDRSSNNNNDKSDNNTTRPVLTREASNAIEAARVALLGMVHMLRPGTCNDDVTDFVARVGGGFGVEALEGVLSHRTKRWVVDGVDCIIARRVRDTTPQQDVAPCRIGAAQVWALDVAFTNHPSSYRTVTAPRPPTSLYRRTSHEFALDARVRGANEVLREITDTHHCFPFHFKSLARPLHAKLGIGVLLKHGVVDALPVLQTTSSSSSSRCIAARFAATVAVTSRRVTVLCGLPPSQPLAVADEWLPLPLPDDVAAVLARPLTYDLTTTTMTTTATTETDDKATADDATPAHKRARHETTEA